MKFTSGDSGLSNIFFVIAISFLPDISDIKQKSFNFANKFLEVYKTGVLNNGIRIIHKEVRSDVAHCGFIINTGSRDEGANQHGMAHFIEHMLFKGTKKRKAFHVLSRLEDIGGEIDAYTTKEETCISASFLCEFYERTIELFNDVIFNSVFPDKEIEKEKDIIFDEINSYKDSPADLIFDEFEELLFQGHPLGLNILGDQKDISKFNKKRIFDFIRTNYHTDQMVFCSIGCIKFNKLFDYCNKYFGQNHSNYRKTKRISIKKSDKKRIIKDKATHQAHCIIGTRAYPLYEPKRKILLLISNLLAGPGMNSRLNMILREKHGISYTVESSYILFTDTGNFNIYFGTDKDKLEKCLFLIYKELEKLKSNILGPVQLSKTKKQVIGQLAISNEINSNQLISMGKSFLLYNKVNSLKESYKEINSITEKQIIEVANEIFQRDNFSELIYR